jgi:hypothetical protein
LFDLNKHDKFIYGYLRVGKIEERIYMPKQSYALEPGGEKKLQLSWELGWKDFKIFINNQPIGTIDSKKELDAGKHFLLPDQSTLEVRLKATFYSTGLELLRNGVPIPGSLGDPHQNLKDIYLIIYLFAAFNFILGLLTVMFQIPFLTELGVSINSIYISVFLGVMAFFISRKSYVALTLVIIFYGADIVLSMISGISTGIFIHIVILVYAFTGYKAIKQIKQFEREQANRGIHSIGYRP